jgi:hypothetical protein
MVGGLSHPIRNDLRSFESNNYPELARQAQELTHRGYTVWIFEHDDKPAPCYSEFTGWHVVGEWKRDLPPKW